MRYLITRRGSASASRMPDLRYLRSPWAVWLSSLAGSTCRWCSHSVVDRGGMSNCRLEDGGRRSGGVEVGELWMGWGGRLGLCLE